MQRAADGVFENAYERGAVHGRMQLSSNSDGESDDEGEDVDLDTSVKPPPAEVTALCWCAASVGVARFLCAECRIEVFEVPVCMVAGEIVRRRRGGPETPATAVQSHAGGAHLISHSTHGNATGSRGDVRIVTHEDIPPSLLWLVRYLQVYQPQVLLPHTGSDALGDLIALVAEQTPVEVIRLSAATAFCGREALPRLAAMYPAQEHELAVRFHADRTAMMCSMAALLQFVAAVQSNVADVVERDVLHALYLDDACAEALQITRTERHPSSGQGRGRAKEGHSLRGLLSAAQSSVGRAMLRQWIALPCCDAAEIETRQSVVAFFVNPLHHDIAARLRAALHRVYSTTYVFTLMRSGRALHKHYVSLYQTMRGIITVQELLATVAHEVSRLYVLLQSIRVEPLQAMAASLDAAVVGVAGRRRGGSAGGGAADTRQDRQPHYPALPTTAALLSFDCGVSNAVCIRDGVDTVLDELRVRFRELRLSLHAKAASAFAELPWTLRARLSLRCVYTVPHGYLLCVPAAELEALLPVKDAADEDDMGGDDRDGDAGEPASWRSDDADNETVGPLSSDAAPRPPRVGATLPSFSPAERVRSVMADSFGWRLHHATEAGECCFKSAAMEELDTWVGDLQRRVQQREEQVRRELDTSLLYNSLHLLRPTRALGELDCLLSFARVSAQEGWCRPDIVAPGAGFTAPHGKTGEEVDEGILEIEDGWHPLLSRHVGMQQLVPFSLHLRTSTDRVCLVLGVNGSGKSVLMGAVAQIVFLAHLGCHVPAVTARLSLVNSIFAPSSSVFASSSSVPPPSAWLAADVAAAAPGSFYGECVALHRVLHFVAGQQRARQAFHGNAFDGSHMAGRALVLLDEFGRGTSPEDGCALLKATLRYFADGGVGCGGRQHVSSSAPLVLCATHLVEMLDLPGQRAAPGLPTLSDTFDCGAAAVVAHSGQGTVAERTDAAAAGVPAPSEPSAHENQRRPDPLTHTADIPLPLEWVKIYEMETHATYAADQDGLTVTESLRAGNDKPIPLLVAGDSGAPLPLDVTPTYQPVCLTPHPGPRRQQDWEQHCSIHLGAGPAIGRQCGLDEELLSCWEETLRVLHRLP
ncbi:MutS-like protein [Leishmania mexicana MHOM/GT/2001/U1103]|uniref:MutS-like protein n=1 Tax=Leishmania mexicana (strain MHOM/GT/2001/U1103) TaxID=929439 RepID=E9ALQ2_LEIMU|nr:MutS-like protein [Leishmania mexicana MHOM/GT/2001/U1103]CBZ23857.1 MutS-like protein [Leishmania mexicana MHOM/GT/2001/U1103]